MKAEIYYFTGTGNSLIVARDIAKQLDGETISISSVIKQENIKTDSDVIGIVFPVYMFGMPLIIERFIKKLENISGKYIFAIATYGGMAGGVINILEKTLKNNGGKLSGGFKVKMPGNYTPMYGAIDDEKQQKMFDDWNKRVEEIAEYIKSKKQGEKENNNLIISCITSTGYNSMSKYIPKMDKDFWFNENCNKCGICEKICPVNNIELIDQKPSWKSKCEQCFACLQWCPQESIQFGKNTSNRKRYHHPDVKISDII